MYIKSVIPLAEYKIIFTYVTKRNNIKQREATLTNISKEAAKETFLLEIAAYNEANRHTPYSNVQILEIKVIGPTSVTV